MTAPHSDSGAAPVPDPDRLPAWVPPGVCLYLRHTATGISLRALAREQGCHASTILRQVRRLENRRDDPLVDTALARLDGVLRHTQSQTAQGDRPMPQSALFQPDHPASDLPDAQAMAILRHLNAQGAVLIVAPDMPKAVVMRDQVGGQTQRLAVLDRALAEAMALREWIVCQRPGRVASYALAPAGQEALRAWSALNDECDGGGARRARYGIAESPVSVLARRRDKDGHPFLTQGMVGAAERLREDFVAAQLDGLRVQPLDAFVQAVQQARQAGPNIVPVGTRAARRRVVEVLGDLGPGLGDVALRCCCFHEGVEAAENALGWSARSGKIVLRIALHRMRLHYDRLGEDAMLIG